MTCYVLTSNPTGAEYEALVDFCCSASFEMILVVRDPRTEADPSLRQTLADLSPHLIRTTTTSEWPGTILYGDEADVHRYRVCSELQAELKRMVTNLFDWVHPDAPEDPCFFRKDGSVLLVTTSHERDAYLLLTDGEHTTVQRRFPVLAALLREEGAPEEETEV